MHIGIDIGGSATKIGALAPDGTILARRSFEMRRDNAFEAFIDAVATACAAIEQTAAMQAAAVGVVCPGYCDPSGILVDGAANVPCLKGRNLGAALEQRLRRPVACGNDGVAAALGELTYGAGHSLNRFAMITLGTGVGGAIVIDRRVVTGSKGRPPELGAIVLDAEATPGTFEHFASTSGFVEAYRRAGGSDPRASGAAIAGRTDSDPLADAAAEAVAVRIAQACGGLVNALALEACLFGGGLSRACPSLPARVARHLPRFTWPFLLRGLKVAAAETGADAGLIGAATLAARESGGKSARPGREPPST